MHLIKAYLSYLNTLGYRSTTIYSKGQRLQHFKSSIAEKDLLQVTLKDITSYYKSLQASKPEVQLKTINTYILTLTQFYDWACLLALIKTHPLSHFKLLKTKTIHTRKPIPITTIKQLYKNCKTPEEKLLLIFCYACGLRLSEVQELKVKDMLLDKNMIIVQSGKGNKRRYIPLKPKHINFIKHYIITNNKAPIDYILSQSNQQLSPYLLRKTLKQQQKRIGLSKPYFSLHHLRHSIASHLVDHGVAIQLVQHFLGHGSLETTQNYVKTTTILHYGTSKTLGNKIQDLHRKNL
ncbi:hypothetical protein A8C32_01715 [Flavivirga aquatica]|uniref:Integrase n=1 Tax=Flavivirga aquatica TaxID=1849968 RepID=A0A1E5TA71_9FLAO|nr:tyrosine-type recombinase/integrase [Flavivirga aquatica]OEK08207.1 hypothetical protein A8C32_01715 [Flavivirga aquatica]